MKQLKILVFCVSLLVSSFALTSSSSGDGGGGSKYPHKFETSEAEVPERFFASDRSNTKVVVGSWMGRAYFPDAIRLLNEFILGPLEVEAQGPIASITVRFEPADSGKLRINPFICEIFSDETVDDIKQLIYEHFDQTDIDIHLFIGHDGEELTEIGEIVDGSTLVVLVDKRDLKFQNKDKFLEALRLRLFKKKTNDLGLTVLQSPGEECSDNYIEIFKNLEPDIVIKFGQKNEESIKDRYNQTLRAKEIISHPNYNKLVIPELELIQLSNEKGEFYYVILEQRLDIDTTYFKDLPDPDTEEIFELLKQFTQFALWTGYIDIRPENNPLIQGEMRIALIDLENLPFRSDKRVLNYIYNSNLTDSQRKIVEGVAYKLGF